jgi:hypothetical protein
VIEAGGGRRPTAAEAKVQYESAQEDVETAVPTPEEGAPDITIEAVGAPEALEAPEVHLTPETSEASPAEDFIPEPPEGSEEE